MGPVRKPHCWFSHEAAHFNFVVREVFHDFLLITDLPGIESKNELPCKKTSLQDF